MEKFYFYIFDGAPGGGRVSLTLSQPPRYLRSNIFHCYSWKRSTTTYLTGHQADGRSALPFVSRSAIFAVIFHCYSWKSTTTTYLTGHQAEGKSALLFVSRPAICVVIYSIVIHGKVLLLHIWEGTGWKQVSLTLCQSPRYLRSNIFQCYSWKSSTTTFFTGR